MLYFISAQLGGLHVDNHHVINVLILVLFLDKFVVLWSPN